MDNLIRSGALRKGDNGLRICFLFQHGFFCVRRGGWINSTAFQRSFFKGIGRNEFYLGWGLTQWFVSWVAREGKVWLILKVGRWDFKIFPKNCFFGGVG